MIKLKKSILISAPPDKVFDVLDDTARIPEIWHNLSNIRNFQRLPNGGSSFDFDYVMAGIKIQGSSVDLEYVRPSRLVTRTTGGLVSTMIWMFNPASNGAKTDLAVEIEYEVPIPLVGKLAEIIIAKINETDVVYVLNYLMLKFR